MMMPRHNFLCLAHFAGLSDSPEEMREIDVRREGDRIISDEGYFVWEVTPGVSPEDAEAHLLNEIGFLNAALRLMISERHMKEES